MSFGIVALFLYNINCHDNALCKRKRLSTHLFGFEILSRLVNGGKKRVCNVVVVCSIIPLQCHCHDNALCKRKSLSTHLFGYEILSRLVNRGKKRVCNVIVMTTLYVGERSINKPFWIWNFLNTSKPRKERGLQCRCHDNVLCRKKGSINNRPLRIWNSLSRLVNQGKKKVCKVIVMTMFYVRKGFINKPFWI